MVPGVTDVALLVPCMFGSRNRILPWLRTGGGEGADNGRFSVAGIGIVAELGAGEAQGAHASPG
jgi:hypothetical protein